MAAGFPKVALLLGALFCGASLSAQVTVSGSVADSVTGEALAFCPYIVKGTMNGGVALDDGSFRLKTNSLPVTLVFTMTGYRTRIVVISRADAGRVLLVPAVLQLAPVTISTDRVITWHPEDAWTFTDFEFYDDYILALVAMRGKHADYLVLIDTLGTTVATLRLENSPDSLYTDCLGALHLFAGDSVYQVYYDYMHLQLPYASARETFVKQMFPCRCQLGSQYYFSFSSYHGQQLDFYTVNWYTKGKFDHFLAIHDSARINDFNENYDIRYFLMRRRVYHEYSEPVDSIVAHIDAYRAALPLSPGELAWLRPVNAPLARLGDSVYIVNTLDSELLCYTKGGELAGSAFFSCMALPGWQASELYADELGGALYGRITDHGYTTFIRIDPQTGKELGRIAVENYAYIRNIRIRSGSAYFLWKDPYSDQPAKMRVVGLY